MARHHETERLLLRPWEAGEEEALHAIWGDPAVIFWGPSPDLAATRKLLRRIRQESDDYPDGFGWFAVRVKGEDMVSGSVFLQPYSYGDGWELGYHVARVAQGRGYATEASRKLIDFALAAGEGPVIALVLPDNAPSQSVVRKLELEHAGTHMHADLLHDIYEARDCSSSLRT